MPLTVAAWTVGGPHGPPPPLALMMLFGCSSQSSKAWCLRGMRLGRMLCVCSRTPCSFRDSFAEDTSEQWYEVTRGLQGPAPREGRSSEALRLTAPLLDTRMWLPVPLPSTPLGERVEEDGASLKRMRWASAGASVRAGAIAAMQRWEVAGEGALPVPRPAPHHPPTAVARGQPEVNTQDTINTTSHISWFIVDLTAHEHNKQPHFKYKGKHPRHIRLIHYSPLGFCNI